MARSDYCGTSLEMERAEAIYFSHHDDLGKNIFILVQMSQCRLELLLGDSPFPDQNRTSQS